MLRHGGSLQEWKQDEPKVIQGVTLRIARRRLHLYWKVKQGNWLRYIIVHRKNRCMQAGRNVAPKLVVFTRLEYIRNTRGTCLRGTNDMVDTKLRAEHLLENINSLLGIVLFHVFDRCRTFGYQDLNTCVLEKKRILYYYHLKIRLFRRNAGVCTLWGRQINWNTYTTYTHT